MKFKNRWSNLFGQLLTKHDLPQSTPEPQPRDIANAIAEPAPWLSKGLQEFTTRAEALLKKLDVEALSTLLEKEAGRSAVKLVQMQWGCHYLLAATKMSKKQWQIIKVDNPYQSDKSAFRDLLVAGFEAIHVIYQNVGTKPALKHPLAALLEAWLTRPTDPEKVRVYTAGAANLARIPHPAKTAALATWEQMPDAVVVEVDGEPVASQLHYMPQRARLKKEERTLLPLPGTQQAIDLRLAMIQAIEQHAKIDRRNPLPGDALYLLVLGSAIQEDIVMHVDRLGAMMTGRFNPTGISPDQRKRWRERAWDSIHWVSMWLRTPTGHWRALLEIETGGLPDGGLRIWPYRWTESKGYRLTGVLTNQSNRQDKSGSFGRLIAGCEDFIAAVGSPAKDRRSRLLIPQKKGGPGPTSEFIPYPHLLARSGFHFDLSDRRSLNATAQLWKRLAAELETREYLLPRLSAEAGAGDTVEIIDIITGKPGPGHNFGGVRIRASARFIEAQTQVNNLRGDRAFDAVPLSRLFH